MDAEHRHELKENDLAEFITHFGQWWAKHGNKLLIVLVIVAGTFTAMHWFESKSQADKEKAWRDLAQTASPDGYRSVALSYQDPAVRALAYLRGADLLLAKATTGSKNQSDGENPSHTQETTDPVKPNQDLQRAEMMYQAVIDDPHAHRAYELNAHLGLAAVAESRRAWDQAREQYRLVSDKAGTDYAIIGTRAQTRLAMLDKLQRPVVFAPNPPTTQPSDPTPSTTEFDETSPATDNP